MANPVLVSLYILFSFNAAHALDSVTLHREAEHLYHTRDQKDHADQAISLYNQILELDSGDETALWKLSRSYLWQGDRQTSIEKRRSAYKTAVHYAEEAIQINPQSVGGHLLRGVALGRMAELEGLWKSLFLISPIKSEMEMVLALDPENDAAHHVLGVLYSKLPRWMGGSLQKSINLLQSAIRKNPKRTAHYLAIADTYLKQKEHGKAISALKRLFDVKHPEDPVQTRIDKNVADAMLRKLTLIYKP